MTNINDKRPEDLLKQESLEAYYDLHTNIWHRLVHLNDTIITLEKITEFPFDYFYGPNKMTFWYTLYWNFTYAAVILAHGLVEDRGENAHTLPRFRNRLLQLHWLDPQQKKAYQTRLRQSKLDTALGPIRKKVKELRDKIIAHRLLDDRTGLPSRNVPGVSVTELRRLYDSVENHFEVCCFGSEYVTTSMDYTQRMVGGKPAQTGVEDVLDCVAKVSHFVNEPEADPTLWKALRKHKPKEYLDVMNKFRRKFHLGEA